MSPSIMEHHNHHHHQHPRFHLTSSSSSSVKMKTTTMMAMMTILFQVFAVGANALSSSSSYASDPNLPFTHFHRISDPGMNVYESAAYKNPMFNKLFWKSDTQQLFLGGLDFLYTLNPSNISDKSARMVNVTSHPDFQVLVTNSSEACRNRLSKTDPAACNNVVQMLYWRKAEESTLRVCTSAYGTPREFVVNVQEMTVTSMSQSPAIGKCSGVPYSNATSLYEETTNSIFYGGPVDMDKDFYYGKFELNSTWDLVGQKLSEKVSRSFEISYVTSLDLDDHIYVFLHEVPFEDTFFRDERIYYARVGRICKNEPGNKMRPKITVTYTKVRVFCMNPMTLYPVYYDVLTDVYYDKRYARFYMLLSRQSQDGTAVCYVDKKSIDSKFENEPLSELNKHCWVPVNEYWPEIPRPPSCTVRQDLKLGEMDYYMEYSLVATTEDATMVIKFDIFFVRFVVEILGVYEYLFWLYSPNEEGYLTRVYVYRNNNDTSVYRRIAKVRLFKKPSQISKLRDLRMETINGDSYIYAVMERLVVQLSAVHVCRGHTRCTTCSVEPTCAWLVAEARCVALDEVKGRDKKDYKNNPKTNSPLDLCSDTCLTNKREVSIIAGTNAVLDCNSVCSPQDGSYPLWYHNGQRIPGQPRVEGATKEGEKEEENDDYDEDGTQPINGDSNVRLVDQRSFRLLVLNATHDFTGTYECRDAATGLTFAATHVTVTKYCKIEGNFESTWRREFNNWCRSYEAYASSYQTWKQQQCTNVDCIKSCC